jgi:ribulose-phosphate 3-epimerase
MDKKRILIAPSLLAADLSRLAEEVTAAEKAGADLLHFDVMDGSFVPNISFGFPVIESLRKLTRLPIDAHLMIQNADAYLEKFAASGCNWLSVHVEACPHLHRTLTRIKELGMRPGVAINPGTALSSLDAVLGVCEFVLVMSVNPGFGGQSFIPDSLERVKALKQRAPHLQIEIDGGIKVDNAKAVIDAGAEVLVVGTGLFGTPDYTKTVQRLRTGKSE